MLTLDVVFHLFMSEFSVFAFVLLMGLCPLIRRSGCTCSVITHLTLSFCGTEKELTRSLTVNSVCSQSQVSKFYVHQLSDTKVIGDKFMAHEKVIV